MVLIKRGFIKVLLKRCSGLIKMKQIKQNPPDIYHCLLPRALPRVDISPRPLVEPLPPFLVVFRAAGPALGLEAP
jgi:hypothetical protein